MLCLYPSWNFSFTVIEIVWKKAHKDFLHLSKWVLKRFVLRCKNKQNQPAQLNNQANKQKFQPKQTNKVTHSTIFKSFWKVPFQAGIKCSQFSLQRIWYRRSTGRIRYRSIVLVSQYTQAKIFVKDLDKL